MGLVPTILTLIFKFKNKTGDFPSPKPGKLKQQGEKVADGALKLNVLSVSF